MRCIIKYIYDRSELKYFRRLPKFFINPHKFLGKLKIFLYGGWSYNFCVNNRNYCLQQSTIISMKSKVKWECYSNINVVVISIQTVLTLFDYSYCNQYSCKIRWAPWLSALLALATFNQFSRTIITTQPVLKQSINSCFTTIWSVVMDDWWMRRILDSWK